MKCDSGRREELVGSIILIAGAVLGSFSLCWFGDKLTGVGLLGIIVLFFTLVGVNVLSKNRDLTTGEVRRAVAISVIAVFFGLIAVGEDITVKETSVLRPLLENFWWIVITVIGFYFGGRSAENIVSNVISSLIESEEKQEGEGKKKGKDAEDAK